MDFWFLMMAAGLSLVSALLHGVLGGQLYMENINSSAMEPLTKSLSLVSWLFLPFFLWCVRVRWDISLTTQFLALRRIQLLL